MKKTNATKKVKKKTQAKAEHDAIQKIADKALNDFIEENPEVNAPEFAEAKKALLEFVKKGGAQDVIGERAKQLKKASETSFKKGALKDGKNSKQKKELIERITRFINSGDVGLLLFSTADKEQFVPKVGSQIVKCDTVYFKMWLHSFLEDNQTMIKEVKEVVEALEGGGIKKDMFSSILNDNEKNPLAR